MKHNRHVQNGDEDVLMTTNRLRRTNLLAILMLLQSAASFRPVLSQPPHPHLEERDKDHQIRTEITANVQIEFDPCERELSLPITDLRPRSAPGSIINLWLIDYLSS